MLKDRLVFKSRVLTFVLLICLAWMEQVQANAYLPPRLSVDANAGGSATVGQADLLLSLKGDERRNLYLDPQAAYGSDEQWYADLGLGYRWIQNDAAILGGYLFASRSQVGRQCGFWIANPGVEALGSRWDARINGYIPVGGRSDDLGIFQFNQSSRFVFSGHTARIVTTYLTGDESQQIGDGVDAKVGYQVFRNVPLKAYLGAYFFNISNADNVRGGAAGVEYWMDRNVKVFANYTYDNLQHGTVVGGLAVSFGGVDEPRADPSLSERLTDPVERYLANLGHGSGIPSDTIIKNLQTQTKIALINPLFDWGGSGLPISAAFFSQTGTPNNGGIGLTYANCTFENPCGPTDFSQIGVNTLNILLPNTLMLFNGGTYPATNGAGALILNNGQGVLGRVTDYSAPASGAARSQFNGAFILASNNTLDSIILNNTLGSAATAMTSAGGQSITINNTTIGSAAAPYGTALNLSNARAVLTQSSANVSSQTGISLTRSSLTLQSSNINLSNNNSSDSINGVTMNTNSSLTLDNSQLNVTTSNFSGVYSTQGILIDGNSTAALNNSQLKVINTSPVGSAEVFGIRVLNASTGVINNSVISITNSANQLAVGLAADANASRMQMIGGSLNVSGGVASLLKNSPSITLASVSCMLNGLATPC